MDQPPEFSAQVLELDDTFQNKVTELAEQGYQILPNVKPLVIYFCFRAPVPTPAPVPTTESPGLGVLNIDDSKIEIIRGTVN